MNGFDYPLFPIFAFLGFIVSCIPLPWHLQAWNSGTCYYMMWTALSCLNAFVNSVIWNGNVINSAPVWCDISIRIMMGSSVAIPTASLCINRRLYHIARVHAVTITPVEKRRVVLIDTLLCVLWPLIFIALQYVVQGHRFNIYEGVGCYPYIYNTIVAFLLTDSWPIIIGLVSAVYCGLSLREFYYRRAQFNQFLASNSSVNASRYFRLMALASTEVLCTVPIASLMIWINVSAHSVEPWVSWDDTHYDFSRVGQYPTIIWSQDYFFVVALQITRWMPVACAFVFFAYFGFAAEACKNYRSGLAAILGLFGSSAFSSRAHLAPRAPMISTDSFLVYAPADRKHSSSPESYSTNKVFDEKDVNFITSSTPSSRPFLEISMDSVPIPDAAHIV